MKGTGSALIASASAYSKSSVGLRLRMATSSRLEKSSVVVPWLLRSAKEVSPPGRVYWMMTLRGPKG